LLLLPVEHVGGRERTDGTVQSSGVVMLDEVADDAAGVFERERNKRADTFALERFVPVLMR